MKQANPVITIIESEEDTKLYQMATGRVYDAPCALLDGVIYANPLGIRAYEEKDGRDGIIRMCEALCEYITGYQVEVNYKPTAKKK